MRSPTPSARKITERINTEKRHEMQTVRPLRGGAEGRGVSSRISGSTPKTRVEKSGASSEAAGQGFHGISIPPDCRVFRASVTAAKKMRSLSEIPGCTPGGGGGGSPKSGLGLGPNARPKRSRDPATLGSAVTRAPSLRCGLNGFQRRSSRLGRHHGRRNER